MGGEIMDFPMWKHLIGWEGVRGESEAPKESKLPKDKCSVKRGLPKQAHLKEG